MAKQKDKTAGTAVAEPRVNPAKLLQQQLAEEAGESQRFEQEALEQYARLILLDNPTLSEARDLVNCARDLGYTPETIEADRRTIAEARRLTVTLDQRAEILQKQEDARAAMRQFLEAIDLEWNILEQRRDFYERQAQLLAGVPYKLHMLARQRTELFDFSVSPPRLKTPV